MNPEAETEYTNMSVVVRQLTTMVSTSKEIATWFATFRCDAIGGDPPQEPMADPPTTVSERPNTTRTLQYAANEIQHSLETIAKDLSVLKESFNTHTEQFEEQRQADPRLNQGLGAPGPALYAGRPFR